MKEKSERRRHKRFMPGDQAAVVVSSQQGNNAYQIFDISMKGLSFRYLGEDQLPYAPMEINILYGNEFQLMRVPVKNTFDCSMENGFMPMRKWGAQFVNLSPLQKSQLEDFIQNHANNTFNSELMTSSKAIPRKYE